MKHEDFKKHPDIPMWRKLCYYGGMILIAIGFVLFLSTFFEMFGGSGTSFEQIESGIWGSFNRSITGWILILIGGIVRGVGMKGLAGSGVILNPNKAREDLHPYTHAAGAAVKDIVDGYRSASAEEESQSDDAFDETKTTDQKVRETQPIVMVRCTSCKSLNPEDAKFCNQCGKAL